MDPELIQQCVDHDMLAACTIANSLPDALAAGVAVWLVFCWVRIVKSWRDNRVNDL